MQKILITGSEGRFGKILKKSNNRFIFTNKKQLNILSTISISKNLKKYRPTHILHLAGLSRPMSAHNKNIDKSIDLNIIGTCNLVKEASKRKIKMIYLSTSYVYPGTKGNYKEEDALKPWNNYAWSKLGGESAVQMYKNSLIIRLCMTEKPFIHKFAFKDLITNFIFQEEFVKILPKLIKYKGVINFGGKTMSVFKFAKKTNKNIKGVLSTKLLKKRIPLNHSMNLKKVSKILND